MGSTPREPTSYARLGAADPESPVVIAVPHAGRHYPPALIAAARLPRAALETIEDRHVDLLAVDAVAAGAVAIVARMARALVDLNRDPREIDAAILRGGASARIEQLRTEKVVGGLGVVPSRIAAGGAVWKRPLDARDIAARIASAHTPYHAAIAQALAAAHARHGIAVLLDLHSMPPLAPPHAARIVLGDRHSESCDPRFMAIAALVAARHGHPGARNRPYSGGFTLDRHGRPRYGIHALQLEIDRSLYLDDALLAPGAGLPAMRTMVADLAASLGEAARGESLPIAAE